MIKNYICKFLSNKNNDKVELSNVLKVSFSFLFLFHLCLHHFVANSFLKCLQQYAVRFVSISLKLIDKLYYAIILIVFVVIGPVFIV